MNKQIIGSISSLMVWGAFLGWIDYCRVGAIEQMQVAPIQVASIQTTLLRTNPLGKEETMAAQQDVSTPQNNAPQDINASQDINIDSRVVAANHRFGFQLFSQLQQAEQSNTLISPSSIALALAMTYNGANGTTQQAMAEVLALQDFSLDELNRANAALLLSLDSADPDVRLAIANSLWGRQGFAFNPEFLQCNREFYNAEITTLDFNQPDAVNRINTWVNDSTEGKIPTIVDQVDPNLVLFLINAVYFKGNWTIPFDESATIDRAFYRLDGTTKQQPTMMQQGRYRYAETEQFQAVSLPYGNRRFSMYVFLPKSTSSLTEFQANLTPENWEAWMRQFRLRSGAIELPRFTFESSHTLNDALKAMGMEVAFSDNADFANLSDTPTTISEVKHKTFIEVNEAGTEAAAATSVGISVTSARPPEPPFELKVDRPFFLAIRDDQTGTLLFLGSIVEPQ